MNAFVFDAKLDSFEQDVINASKETPVLVDFWAEWCGPCKQIGPLLEKLALEFNGGFLLAKVDVDKEQQLAGYFQIKSIPTLMLLKDGKIVDGFSAALSEAQLREFLSHHQRQFDAAIVFVPEHESARQTCLFVNLIQPAFGIFRKTIYSPEHQCAILSEYLMRRYRIFATSQKPSP